ncbi:hypothetical protein M514_05717 [Trichuris suis]|uniref:Microtubule-associated protein n=1 Tax=Trichuris suis TaxID=68888 RepID=A0A085NAI8_9BILA|nr:hypothetical protein M513_05717 [Trichuris suis]KFD66484.1 hypothetical protein M514_05717 [Trichuris suis]KHJ49037.1 Tau and MAP protein, tubulin-binding repeat protein [Trichuris suis]
MDQSPTGSDVPDFGSSQMEKENNPNTDEPLFSLLPSAEPEKDKAASSPDKSPESNEHFTMTLIKPLGDPVLEQSSPTIQKGEAVQPEPSPETSPVDVVNVPTLQDAPVFLPEPLVTSTPVSTNVNVEARLEPPSLLASFVHKSPGDRPSVQAGVVDQSNNVFHPMSKSPDHVSVDHAIATPKLEECSANVAAFQPVQLEKPSAPSEETTVVEENVPKVGPPSKAKAPGKENAHPAHEPAKTTGQVREKAHPTAQAAKKAPMGKAAATTERKPREPRKTVPPASGTRREHPLPEVHPATKENMRAVTRTTTKAASVANGRSEAKSLPSKAAVQPKKIVRRSEAKSAERTKPSVGATQKPPTQVKSSVSAPKPETKNVQPRVGSLENAAHKPTTTGRVQIQHRKLDFSKTAKSKIGSLDNIKYKPAGGNVKIFEQKLNFKSKAHSKVAAETEKTTPSKSSEAVASEAQNGSDPAVPATSVA